MDENAKKLIIKLVVCLLASCVVGLIGGAASVFLTGPFYFGFILGFILAGLTSLFVLAAHFSHSPPN